MLRKSQLNIFRHADIKSSIFQTLYHINLYTHLYSLLQMLPVCRQAGIQLSYVHLPEAGSHFFLSEGKYRPYSFSTQTKVLLKSFFGSNLPRQPYCFFVRIISIVSQNLCRFRGFYVREIWRFYCPNVALRRR